jgi:hypothetical protein
MQQYINNFPYSQTDRSSSPDRAAFSSVAARVVGCMLMGAECEDVKEGGLISEKSIIFV